MKFFSAALAIIIFTVTLSSCSAEETAVVENEDYVTAAAPAEGWDWEQLTSLMYINGVQLSYPFSVSDLGRGYILGELGAGNYYVGGIVYVGNSQLFSVRYYIEDVSEFEDITLETEAAGLMFSSSVNTSDIPDEELFSVNGITLGSTIGEVEDMMGYPDSVSGNAYMYNVGETGIEFDFTDDIVSLINVYWE
ncbi:MAG: hypothetical protein LIO69_04980 [Oscillospiraceae bacterium]|nr:hypothetical protein [Oscillospiraceae bacterium]